MRAHKDNFFRFDGAKFDDDEMSRDVMLSRLHREMAKGSTKPFYISLVSTLEDEGNSKRVRKEVGKGLHFTVGERKQKRRYIYPHYSGVHESDAHPQQCILHHRVNLGGTTAQRC